MTCALTTTTSWQRTRAAILHDHFRGIHARLTSRLSTLTEEIERMSQLVNGKIISEPDEDEERFLKATPATLFRAWAVWQKGKPEDGIAPHTAETLLHDYKAGCGGHKKAPRELVKEFQRRCTLPTGARDKDGKAPISVVMKTLREDYKHQRPLPGVDYTGVPMGAELPWSYRTFCRQKPARQLRALGNQGSSAYKAATAFITMDYSRLRKGEMYTLDDVRLDILCMDEATGKVIEVVIYLFMEVASRAIAAYILKPRAAIKAEDVDELVALALQTKGFGIGVDYVTHIYFERGTTACSPGAQLILETTTGDTVTHGIKVHRTGMISGVRWIGAPADKARGNAAAKGVIESFNGRLHFALLNLPGQRGNNWSNAPQNLGYEGPDKLTPGSTAEQAEKLASFTLAAADSGHRVDLKMPLIYFMHLHQAVREAIKVHNKESGHAYRGHGTHFEAEIQPGVWQRQEPAPEPVALPVPRNIHFEEALSASAPPREICSPPETQGRGGKQYKLNAPAQPFASLSNAQKNAAYFGAWNKIQLVNPKLDRFALTRRTLGAVPKPVDMTPEQFQKMLGVFAAIVRDAKPAPSANEPF